LHRLARQLGRPLPRGRARVAPRGDGALTPLVGATARRLAARVIIRGLQIGVRCVLAAVLAVAAVSKLARPRATASAFTNLGIRSSMLRWAAWGAAATSELVLAA